MSKVCWECGNKVLMKDVAGERTRYPGQKVEYLCRSCKKKRVDELVDKEREAMGMDPLGGS